MPPCCTRHQQFWSSDNAEHELRCAQCHDEAERRAQLARYDVARDAFRRDAIWRLEAALKRAVVAAGGAVRVSAMEINTRQTEPVTWRYNNARDEYVLTVESALAGDAVDPHVANSGKPSTRD